MFVANSENVVEDARIFAHGHWSFLGPGTQNDWYGSHTYKPNGEWDRFAEDVMIHFSDSGHSVYRGSSALERGALKSKGNGQLTIHFCGDDPTAEVVLRTQAIRRSAQFLQSRLSVIWTSMESKFQSLPRVTRGWSYPEAHTAAWTAMVQHCRFRISPSLKLWRSLLFTHCIVRSKCAELCVGGPQSSQENEIPQCFTLNSEALGEPGHL